MAAGASVSATTLAKVVVNRSRCMMMVRWMNKTTAVAVAGVFELEFELASGIGASSLSACTRMRTVYMQDETCLSGRDVALA